jgi:hypothetical protein
MLTIDDVISSWLSKYPSLSEKHAYEEILTRRGYLSSPAAGVDDADVRVELINRLRQRGDGTSLSVLQEYASWDRQGHRDAARVARAARLALKELESRLTGV